LSPFRPELADAAWIGLIDSDRRARDHGRADTRGPHASRVGVTFQR